MPRVEYWDEQWVNNMVLDCPAMAYMLPKVSDPEAKKRLRDGMKQRNCEGQK
jgi:hypothetical protein